MKIIKRSGMEVVFNAIKIEDAVRKANKSVQESDRLSNEQISTVVKNVTDLCKKMQHSPNVEEIQDLVEEEIMKQQSYKLASNYITYRYKRALVRKSNSTDEQILSLLECNNEEVLQENCNKDAIVNSVQRDYMAGEVSKDITKRFLLPEDIVDAHEKGLIHFHDSDYFAQHMHNCCLVNLEDMLQNGTIISETMIETPKSFSTACNVATPAIAQIARSQYGGQSISLTHLAPFVDVSRQKIVMEVREELKELGCEGTKEQMESIVEKRLKDALLPFGDPVEKSFLYAAADDLPRQYYTFSASSRGDDFGDDVPGCEVWQVSVHFFAPLEGDFSQRRQQTKRALHRAGFTWPRCIDAGDQDGQHLVFECEIAEGVDLDGEV